MARSTANDLTNQLSAELPEIGDTGEKEAAQANGENKAPKQTVLKPDRPERTRLIIPVSQHNPDYSRAQYRNQISEDDMSKAKQ